ncbi:hypothetical protein NMG60_11031823 [Bertholletia excelsa]
MPNWKELVVSDCKALEKINLQLSDKHLNYCDYGFNENLVEFTVMKNNSLSCVTRIEPLYNVDDAMNNNFGLSKSVSMSEPTVVLFSTIWDKTKQLPPQLICERNWIGTFLPGSKIPESFNFRTIGSSISIGLPSRHGPNLRIQGLSLGVVYQFKDSFELDFSSYRPSFSMLEFTIINRTKNQRTFFYSHVHGVPKVGEDMTWLLYYSDLEMQFEARDELDISIHMDTLHQNRSLYKVIEVGVRIVYEEQKEKIVELNVKEEGYDKHIHVLEMQLPDESWPSEENVLGKKGVKL